MKIKDLKQPYKEMALIEQEAQGNERNEKLELSKFKIRGNFDWDDSICGDDFWQEVYYGNTPEITPEIKAKFPSVFKEDILKELIQLFEKYEEHAFDFYCIKNEYYKALAEEIVENFINKNDK